MFLINSVKISKSGDKNKVEDKLFFPSNISNNLGIYIITLIKNYAIFGLDASLCFKYSSLKPDSST